MIRKNVQTIILFFSVGFHPSCLHTRLPIPPMCHHSSNLPVFREKDDGSAEERKKKEEEGGFQKEMKDPSFVSQPQQQEMFLSTARSPFQGHASSKGLGGSNHSMAINQKRIFSLEPFHQSSIISSRQKRGRDKEREEEEEDDNSGNPNKKTKLTNSKNSKIPTSIS